MRTAMGRKVLSALLSIIFFLSSAGTVIPAWAETASATPEREGGAVLAEYFDSGDTAADAEAWEPLSGSLSAIVTDSKGNALRVSSRTASAGIEADFGDEPLYCADAAEVGIFIRPLTADCTVTFTVTHDRGESEVTADILSGKEYYIFAELPDGAADITKLEVDASFRAARDTSGTAIASSFLLRRAVFSTSDHTAIAERFSAFAIDGLDEEYTVTGNAIVSAAPLLTDEYGESYAIRLRLSGVRGGVSVQYSSDGVDFGVCGSSVITEDRSVYIFRVGALTPESAYRLEFTGTDDTVVRLDSVDFIPVNAGDSAESLGTVSKCSYSEKTLTVEGSITRDAAVEYIDGEVCIYEIPMWQDSAVALTGEPLESISMSTSFSFSIPLSEDHSVFTAYAVAIRTSDEVIPMTKAMFPSRGVSPEARSSTGAVCGISPEDAFSSGFDNYVIEVNTAELFLEKSGEDSTVFTHDGSSFYPDKTFTSEMDKRFQFLSASGIGLIFSLSAPDGTGFDPAVEADCRILAAAVAYLAGRYSPYGFITSAAYGEDTAVTDRAGSAASIVRLTAAVAGGGSVVYAEIDSTDDPETFAWLLSGAMAEYPRCNWEIGLTGITGDTVGIADAVAALAADGGYSSPLTLSFASSGEDITGLLEKILAEANRSYVIEVADGEDPHVSTAKWQTYAITDNWVGEDSDTVTLWDFTGSYDSGGFTVPAGKTGVFTGNSDALAEYTGLPLCRALKTVLGNGSEVIMAQPSSPMRLTHCPLVRFLMVGEADAPFSIDIVFISGKTRAVFTADFDGSGVFAPVCDLAGTGIADRVERIAIVLRGGGPVELGIATVTAAGSSENVGFADTVFITGAPAVTNEAPSDSGGGNETVIVAASAGILVLISVVVFAALSMKKT